MKKKRLIPICLLLLLSATTFAQNATVHFGYDANGNRTSRTLSIRKTEENGKPTDTLKSPVFLGEANDSFGKATATVYPNPTRDVLTVKLQGLGTNLAEASIITTAGVVIHQTELSDGSHDFDLSGLPAGIYLLRLAAPDISQTWKIIKN